ncbi:MAG TPA: hypothetical protein VFN85_07940 [Solirubrobacterales bacterium]|nr:hypothetical protein [Solirubrobacterales bacterium]
MRLPRLFIAAGTRRGLIVLGALALIFGAAMLPAIATMANHGASVIDFESARTVARSREILSRWGEAGERAMWWQLALDTPFAVCYGLLFSGGCAAVAGRAHRVGKPRLERAAVVFAWAGALAAVADLVQNVSLAIVLADPVSQPWPAISAFAAPTTTILGVAAATFALGGALATRSSGTTRS